MFYSDNHVEVSLDAFLASEEYAKESIKDVEMVFDQNADRSIETGPTQQKLRWLCFNEESGSRTARPRCEAARERASGTFEPKPGQKGGRAAGGTPAYSTLQPTVEPRV